LTHPDAGRSPNRMDFGVTIFATDYTIPVDRLARAAEERGFESLWLPEHTHIPTSRRSPWPGGAALPKEYWHTHDPFVALAVAATVTERLKVATGICLLVERDPITTAKEVATLDVLSGGRFLFGIGGGWNAEEMESHGTVFRTRWKLLRERVQAMKRIWTEDEPSFQGELVQIAPMWAWPKPVQKPHPPVILGGHGPRALARVVEYADGWLPISVRAGDLGDGIKALRALAKEKGRDPDSISISVYGVPPDPDTLKWMRDAGVQRGIFALPSADADKVLGLVDRAAAAMRQVT
jgi:probable F420-dependent oxidoreductase